MGLLSNIFGDMFLSKKEKFIRKANILSFEYKILDGVLDIAENEELRKKVGLPEMPKEAINAMQIHRMDLRREMNQLGIKPIEK